MSAFGGKADIVLATRSRITNTRTKRNGDDSLDIGYQAHKSLVLMVLMVAVQK
jgi:hypothetical protein